MSKNIYTNFNGDLITIIKNNDQAISALSYFSFIGWGIAFVLHEKREHKSNICLFHLRQAFGLAFISNIIFLIIYLFSLISYLSYLSMLTYSLLIFFNIILFLIGLYHSIKKDPNELPIIGVYISKYLGHILNTSKKNQSPLSMQEEIVE